MKLLKTKVIYHEPETGCLLTSYAAINLDHIVMVKYRVVDKDTAFMLLTNGEEIIAGESQETIVGKIESLNEEHPEP